MYNEFFLMNIIKKTRILAVLMFVVIHMIGCSWRNYEVMECGGATSLGVGIMRNREQSFSVWDSLMRVS